jgi:hypothetical protein
MGFHVKQGPRARQLMSQAFHLADLVAGTLGGARCPNCDAGRGEVRVRKSVPLATVRACHGCGLYYRPTGLQGSGFARWYYSNLYTDVGIATNPEVRPKAEVLAWARREGKDRTALVTRAVSFLAAPPPWIAVLGASWGYEVMTLSELGFCAWGIEAADDRRAFGQRHYGVELYQTVAEGVARHGPGGVILSSHVIEHIARLSTFLAEVERTARPVAHLHVTPRVEPLSPETATQIGREHPIGLTTDFWRTTAARLGRALALTFHQPAATTSACELVALLMDPAACRPGVTPSLESSPASGQGDEVGGLA